MDSDSGVFGTGQLRDLALVAQAIDHGMKELETALSSVDNLMPSEEKQPEALETMKAVQQEVKDIEENSSQMLAHLEKILAAIRLEGETADEANRVMEEGLLQVESVLEKYGYDGSKMPAYIPLNNEESNASEHLEDSECSDDEPLIEAGENDHSFLIESLQENATRTPAQRVSRSTVETMAGAEITPLVLSSKLNVDGSKSSSKIRVSPRNPYIVKSPNSCAGLLSLNMPVEKVKETPADFFSNRPVRPVLSTTTFDD